MADYKQMYFKMAAKMADAVEVLQQTTEALINAQRECEETFIETEDAPVIQIYDDPEG